MDITRTKKYAIDVQGLNAGDTFVYEDDVFMKTDDISSDRGCDTCLALTGINTEPGTQVDLAKDLEVECISVKLVEV